MIDFLRPQRLCFAAAGHERAEHFLMTKHDSTDRKPAEYLLFAVGFGGFMLAAAGLVLNCLALAVAGGLMTLFAVACFLGAP